ncbi:MAG: class I SAM-dependent methyltransferase [Candidatus Marinimicrobia bacterium]|nr:class I SAM-dependent methyltransferase [Candidatus Neomarinimicrobiota bacterium]
MVSREDNIIFKIKTFLKKYPRVFFFFYYTMGVFVGKSAKKAIRDIHEGATIINLGSGSKIIREDVVNVDFKKHPGINVVADVCNLPFDDNSVDAVISESLMEHLKDPQKSVEEILRVLKPGGLVYIVTPFMLGYHSSPGDYYRWTMSGLRELLKDFEEKEMGVAMGPTNAMTYMLREWLALILSFGSNTLYQIWTMFFMVVFAPLNLLDFILARFKSAKNSAYAYYFIGTKR